MEKELNLDELEKVNVSPNNNANYENSINSKELYCKSQIEELKRIKESFLNKTEQKNNKR